MLLADELTQNKDKFDPNTICGCMNRIKRLLNVKKFSDKYNIIPDSDKTSWIFWKLQEASFWPADEIDYSLLKHDYINASPAIRKAVDLVNGWFAGGDGIIVQNIGFRFAIEADNMAELGALLTQLKQEFVHGETYMKTITSMIPDPKHRNEVLKMADNLKCVRDKEILMEKYMESDIPKSYRIIAFACSEGISFWTSFQLIFWLKAQGLFISLADINELISKDEGMHRDYGCARFRLLNKKPPLEHIHRIVDEFVQVEYKFANVLTSPLVQEGHDLTSESMHKFIRFMANNLLVGLGCEPVYKDTDFPHYMRNISSSQKSNFYEVNVASYQQFSVNELLDNKNSNDIMNDDFDFDNVDF